MSEAVQEVGDRIHFLGRQRVDGQVASGGIAANYCFRPEPAGGKAVLNVGTLSLVGEVSGLWGLVSHNVNYPIFGGWTSPPIEF